MKRTVLLVASLVLALGVIARGDSRGEPLDYEHAGTTLKGYLAVDPSIEGKRPGVLVVHEWWGQNEYARHRADMLASLGYVALAVDMYGNGTTTKDPKEAGALSGKAKADPVAYRARAAAGLEVLKKHPLVDPTRTAAIGYCFGGTVVLELARSGADLNGVVSFHGGLATKLPAEKGKVKARVLVLNGGDDKFVSDKELADFKEEMRAAGVDWQLVSYGGAVHSFTNPESGKFGLPGVSYDANADRRSWRAMRDFFDELFATK